jgi:arylsulfatase A-like enzyme
MKAMAGRSRNGGWRQRAALAAAAALPMLTAACRPSGPALELRQRNVVLISVDTLRADRLNAYGYEARRTSPNLDALASDGILFEHHITASPWTIPSHMSLLTSLYPTAHGVTRSFRAAMDGLAAGTDYDRLPERALTLAEALAASGRTTAAFTGGVTLDPRFGFDQGFASYATDMYKLDRGNVDAMLRWIAANRDRPFFLFWHSFEVHAPYLQTAFLGDVLPSQQAAALGGSLERLVRLPGPLSTRAGREALQRHAAWSREVCGALYDGGVLSFDRWLGELVRFLKEQGLYERTLIVFTSDHGEQLGEPSRDPERSRFYDAHGRTLYDEMIRVPLVLKLPGPRPARARIAAVTRAIDVMPTILDLVGATPERHAMQGASLRPLWARPGRLSTPPALSEALADEYEKKSLRTDRHKYIVSLSREQVAARGRHFIPEQPQAVELYHLATDPGERRNLLASSSPRLVEGLDRALREALARRVGQAGRGRLDTEAIEALRALGYIQ